MLEFLSKKSEKVFLVRLNVKPNSKVQKIAEDDEFLTIYLKSKPIQNKANKELLKLLKNRLKGLDLNKIQIISGLKSSNKTIELVFLGDQDENTLYQKIIS